MATIRLTDTALDSAEIERGTREAWTEALADPEVQGGLRKQGIADPDDLTVAKITVREPEDIGVDSFGTVLVTIATGVAVNIIDQLFKEFVLPKLKERFGADAVGQAVGDAGNSK